MKLKDILQLEIYFHFNKLILLVWYKRYHFGVFQNNEVCDKVCARS